MKKLTLKAITAKAFDLFKLNGLTAFLFSLVIGLLTFVVVFSAYLLGFAVLFFANEVVAVLVLTLLYAVGIMWFYFVGYLSLRYTIMTAVENRKVSFGEIFKNLKMDSFYKFIWGSLVFLFYTSPVYIMFTVAGLCSFGVVFNAVDDILYTGSLSAPVMFLSVIGVVSAVVGMVLTFTLIPKYIHGVNLVVEHPEMEAKAAMKQSKELMKGNVSTYIAYTLILGLVNYAINYIFKSLDAVSIGNLVSLPISLFTMFWLPAMYSMFERSSETLESDKPADQAQPLQ